MTKTTKLIIVLGVAAVAAAIYFMRKGGKAGALADDGKPSVDKSLRFLDNSGPVDKGVRFEGAQVTNKADRFADVPDNPKSIRFS